MTSSYSPVVTGPAGAVHVDLAADHPGVTDVVYRSRRDDLAALAAGWAPGEAVPRPTYTAAEHEVWRTVSVALASRFRENATARFLAGVEALGLPVDRVPQLDEVSRRLAPWAFTYQPVAGLAPLRDFYGDFADGVFWSTQYLRHPSAPLYTPEPDLVHEVLGHAHQLADPAIADLYRLVGRAVRRTTTDVGLHALSRIFWFTFEFGVVHEGGRARAFGAGLLSSVGELDAYRDAVIVPADLAAMATADYDITRFQPVLYAYRSDDELIETLGELFESFDDERAEQLGARRGATAIPHP